MLGREPGGAVAVWGDVRAIPADPAPPVQYSWWVIALGLVLLAVVALWYWWVFHRTRPRPAEDEGSDTRRGGRDPHAAVRAEMLAEVESAYGRYQAGDADLRDLHLDFNHIMRRFASARTGLDTSSLTVSELGRLERSEQLRALLEDFQEPAFAAASDAKAAMAADQAREVIRTW